MTRPAPPLGDLDLEDLGAVQGGETPFLRYGLACTSAGFNTRVQAGTMAPVVAQVYKVAATTMRAFGRLSLVGGCASGLLTEAVRDVDRAIMKRLAR